MSMTTVLEALQRGLDALKRTAAFLKERGRRRLIVEAFNLDLNEALEEFWWRLDDMTGVEIQERLGTGSICPFTVKVHLEQKFEWLLPKLVEKGVLSRLEGMHRPQYFLA